VLENDYEPSMVKVLVEINICRVPSKMRFAKNETDIPI
jgi:hypothetical protein